jgi:hypothetical protein
VRDRCVRRGRTPDGNRTTPASLGYPILCERKGWGHDDRGRGGLIRKAMLMAVPASIEIPPIATRWIGHPAVCSGRPAPFAMRVIRMARQSLQRRRPIRDHRMGVAAERQVDVRALCWVGAVTVPAAKAHRPSGAWGCRHGWSPSKAYGTRGERGKEQIPPQTGRRKHEIKTILRPFGAAVKETYGTMGFASSASRRTALHPRLQPATPPGSIRKSPELSRTLLGPELASDGHRNGRDS